MHGSVQDSDVITFSIYLFLCRHNFSSIYIDVRIYIVNIKYSVLALVAWSYVCMFCTLALAFAYGGELVTFPLHLKAFREFCTRNYFSMSMVMLTYTHTHIQVHILQFEANLSIK